MIETNRVHGYLVSGSIYLGLLASIVSGCERSSSGIVVLQEPSIAPTEIVGPVKPSEQDGLIESVDFKLLDHSLKKLPDPGISELSRGIDAAGDKTLSPELQENISRSVVFLRIDESNKSFGCGGTHIGDGMIVTADHCFGQGGPNEVSVNVFDAEGREYKPAKHLGIEGIDVAIIQLENYEGLSSVPLGNTQDIPVGDRLFTTALVAGRDNPKEDRFHGIYSGSASEGTITNADKVTQEEYYETPLYGFSVLLDSGIIRTGYSGGAVFNSTGELVGVYHNEGISSVADVSISAGYAVRSEIVHALAKHQKTR